MRLDALATIARAAIDKMITSAYMNFSRIRFNMGVIHLQQDWRHQGAEIIMAIFIKVDRVFI